MFIFFVVGCATFQNWGTTTPPIVRVNVVNFMAHTNIGITTEIYFSVMNVSPETVNDLTLEVVLNPSHGVEVPFRFATIGSLAPNESWRPKGPFLVRGRESGTTSVFFIVKRGSEVLAKGYTLVEIPPDDSTSLPILNVD